MGKASRKKAKAVKTAPAISEKRPHTLSEAPLGKSGILQRYYIHLILIAVLGFLAYSNTFNVPFQWDEHNFIIENPIVKDLGYFLEPSKAEGFTLYSAVRNRYIGYLTFALNYRLHGLDVTGYHVVNLTIHLLNAMLVYLLVILTFRTPFLRVSALREKSGYIALFSALLFVSHPIQTEAVTYIFQRLASLAAFFCLLSIVSYVVSRLSEKNPVKYSFHALSVITAILAMKTKENAFTLPIIIALYEFFFLTGKIKRRMLLLFPLIFTMFIIPFSVIGSNKPIGEIFEGVGLASRGYAEITRSDYLLTQFRVIVTYIRLIFLPINQNFAYDYPIYNSVFNPNVLLAFVSLASLFFAASYLVYHSRMANVNFRLIGFGIFWFFITLLIESSIIPIPMLINEYRIYMPSVGISITLTTGLFILFERLKSTGKAAILLMLCLLSTILGAATYTRNAIWESETSLWEDVTKKSSMKAEGYYRLGTAYMSKGIYNKAIEQFDRALKLKPAYTDAYITLGVACSSKGFFDKAIAYYESALRLKPDEPNAYLNMGVAFMGKGAFKKAIEYNQMALKYKRDFVEAYFNIGLSYENLNEIEKAVEFYNLALKYKPELAEAHFQLGKIYLSQGLRNQARYEFETALNIKPHYEEARQMLLKLF